MYGIAVNEEGLCTIRAPFDPALRLAVRAIPGRYWNQQLRAWTVRLGPDRAAAVVRLMRSFALEADEASLERLRALVQRRDPARPVIEAVIPEDGWALSLCDDWDHAVVEDLSDAFEVIAHREVGRVSVPITSENREALNAAVAANRVGLSPRARECIEVGPPTAAPPAPPVFGPPQWRGWVTARNVDGRPWFAFRTRDGELPEELRAHPDAREADGVRLLPMVGRHAEFVGGLLSGNRQMLVDRRAARCLDRLDPAAPDDPPPPGVLTLASGADLDEFRLDILWGAGLLRGIDDLGMFVADPSNAPAIDALVAEHGVEVTADARERLDELLADYERGRELVELSRARDAQLDLPATVHGTLMPFQSAGVAYALRQRRAFIADEQGLGKTIQALAAIELAGAFPAVVVCPASLKLNWLRECERWLPGRSAESLSGRGRATPAADVVVVNYDVLDAHVDALAELDPRALVLDESHYCKNPKARRTKAAIALSKALSPDAYRFALTGTPLVNRPKELVPQLRALRRMDDFGSGASFERRFTGDAARQRLHWHLRSRCYVRRRKEEVLPQLPAKRRITVPVPLTNEAEYRSIESDLIAWLHEAVPDPEQLAARVDTALRAEALVKLNALRHVAARGKLAAAEEWIESFLATGERLVVFAHHRDIQGALVERFPDAARILGTDSLAVRDENVQRFQRRDAPLCVCSLEAASHGFTLTAAANVVFLELGWTPAKHDQAEDRIHRIGQDRHVTAWYLLAADTIDERIAGLIDYKRAVVGSVTDGTAGAEVAVVDRLLQDLATEESPRSDPAAAAA